MAEKLYRHRREVLVDVGINDLCARCETGHRCPPHLFEVAPTHEWCGGTTWAEWCSEFNIVVVGNRIEIALAKAMNVATRYVVQLFCSSIHTEPNHSMGFAVV